MRKIHNGILYDTKKSIPFPKRLKIFSRDRYQLWLTCSGNWFLTWDHMFKEPLTYEKAQKLAEDILTIEEYKKYFPLKES